MKVASLSGFTHQASGPAYNRRLNRYREANLHDGRARSFCQCSGAPASGMGHTHALERRGFPGKTAIYQLQRGIRDLAAGPQFLSKSNDHRFSITIGASQTPLWSEEGPEERAYQLGKVQNLRRATAALDGVIVPAGAVFSFWEQIGRASRRRGFVTGRMLQQGCLVPAAGGGLCQLSNALYDAALQAGCEIVERHAHSRIVVGSAAGAGRDATVAWNYVDLRFRALKSLRIEA